MFLLPMNSRTIALLAIVCGLVVLCLGMWYIWNTQQLFRSEMQYVRDQCDQLQKQLFLPNATPPKHAVSPIEHVDEDSARVARNENVQQNNSNTDTIVHRSCVINDLSTPASSGPSVENAEDSELSEEDTTDEEDYDDDDQLVQKEDLVEANGDVPLTTDDGAMTNLNNQEHAEQDEDANQLVQSLLSNIVSETVENMTDPVDIALTGVVSVNDLKENNDDAESHTLQDATDESVEDFMESTSDYNALADTLRKKTVVELKKMCQEYQIGIKNGKSFKRKEELIGELVEKLP